MLKYGMSWGDHADALQIEMAMIRAGGHITLSEKRLGLGLFHHFRAMESLLFPEDDHHRWSDLILKSIIENRIVAVCGARDSGKTRTVSKWLLCDYYCHPEETLILMTSTDTRGLELRLFGDLKSLHERAKDRYPWLPGNAVDSRHAIFTDNVTDGESIRDQRKGCIGIPRSEEHTSELQSPM